MARFARQKPKRSGGAGRKGGWGERNSRPGLAFAAAKFRILLCEIRRLKIFLFAGIGNSTEEQNISIILVLNYENEWMICPKNRSLLWHNRC